MPASRVSALASHLKSVTLPYAGWRNEGRSEAGSQAVLESRFRQVMAEVATPVAVVTATSNDLPHGTTVSAFASLSLTPPMVVVCLDQRSELLAAIQRSRRLGVNVLSASQHGLALTFAKKGGPAKFEGVEWRLDSELPRITGATGWLACRVDALVEGGDHVLALAEVQDADTAAGAPLTYHRRVFGTHSQLEMLT